MSDKENCLPDLPSKDFVQKLVGEIRAGWGIIPFTGAGVSMRSGLMVGRDFTNYLSWVIYLCVWGKQDSKLPSGREAIRDLRTEGWPSRPDEAEVKEALGEIQAEFKRICETNHRLSLQDESDGLKFGAGKEDASSPGSLAWSRPLTPLILKSSPELKLSDDQIRTFSRTIKDGDPHFQPPPQPNQSPVSKEAVIEAAIRSLHDWRSMLHFLSRITVRYVGTRGDRRAKLAEPDPSVVDSFNQHITRGRKPNLTHSMLAHLAAPMRSRILFTTNFDSLHEEAFHQLGLNPERLSVSVKQGLPALDTVRSRNSIIKLHGSFTGTRADFSLDEPPPKEEMDKFFHCVIGHAPTEKKEDSLSTPSGWVPSHVLVIGNGLGDARLVHFLKYLLEYHSDFNLFLVGFNQADLNQYKNLFGSYSKDRVQRVHITITDRSDLLLLELYQSLTLTLPKGGFSYHYAHDVPAHIWRGADDALKLTDLAQKSAASLVDKVVDGNDAKKILVLCPSAVWVKKPAHYYGPGTPTDEDKCNSDAYDAAKNSLLKSGTADSPEKAARESLSAHPFITKDEIHSTGVTNVVREAFRRLTNEHYKQVVWMELEDYTDVLSLAHQILHVIALRRGKFQLEQAVLLSDTLLNFFDESFKKEFKKEFEKQLKLANDYLGSNLSEYVVCLYGRNGPGRAAGWDGAGWKEADYRYLFIVMKQLAKAGMSVLYLPLTKERVVDFTAKMITLDNRFQTTNVGPHDDIVFSEAKRNDIERFVVAPDSIRQHVGGGSESVGLVAGVEGAVKDLEKLPPQARGRFFKPRFLYATSLFRASRPPSAFLTGPIFQSPIKDCRDGADNDWIRSKVSESWLYYLKFRDGLIWRKPGGNSWLYRDAQMGLRLLLEKDRDAFWARVNESGGQAQQAKDNPQFLKSRMHLNIARWYFRAYCSTNHGIPLLESFHHFYQGLLCVPQAEPERLLESGSESQEIMTYQSRLWIRLVIEWIKVARVGRAAIQFWYDPVALNGWFGRKALAACFKQLRATRRKLVWREEEKELRNQLLKSLVFEIRSLSSTVGRSMKYPTELSGPDVYQSSHSVFRKAKIYGETFSLPEPVLRFETEIGLVAIENEWPKCAKHGDSLIKLLDWCLPKNGKPRVAADLPYATYLLKQRVYEMFKHAKVQEFRHSLTHWTRRAIPAAPDARESWNRVVILSKLAVDACSLLPPLWTETEMGIRVEVLGLHAVALARLGRFFQAHCRLNEAHALLCRIPKKVDQTDFAILELRRAEVRLLEAEQVGNLASAREFFKTRFFKTRKIEAPDDSEIFAHLFGETSQEFPDDADDFLSDDPNLRPKILATQLRELYWGLPTKDTDPTSSVSLQRLQRLLVAKMDDAWNSIEAAEQLLSGQIREPLWWARLCSLKLRFFKEHTQERTKGWKLLAKRRKQDLSSELLSWLRLGIANAHGEFRKTRLVWYYLLAKDNWSGNDNAEGQWLNQSEIALISSLSLHKDERAESSDNEEAQNLQDQFGKFLWVEGKFKGFQEAVSEQNLKKLTRSHFHDALDRRTC